MKVYYNGLDYYVSGSYTPGVRPTYARDYIEDGGAASSFDIESAIRHDCDINGNDRLIDATDEMMVDADFQHACLLEYERSET